jgi:hypothetical protein
MTVMPISPTNDAFVRLGRAADMLARENESMTREDVMDAFKCGIFYGDWEFPPQPAEAEARQPRRLQMEIPVPASTLPPVLQSLDLRPRAFYAVNRSTIASVMYCARALPGVHADWKRLFDFGDPGYDEELPYRTLAAIPFRQFPNSGRHELEILLAPKATLAAWLTSHHLPVPLAFGGRLLIESQTPAPHSHNTEPSLLCDQRQQGRPHKRAWPRIVELVRELHAAHPDWQKKQLAFEGWRLAGAEFASSELPSVATIQRDMVAILGGGTA